MREIKFRAWDKNTDTLVNVKTLDIDNNGVGCVVDFDGINLDRSECELMQYTGLKDKNGVEIYEGDVVKITDCKYGNKFRGEISFKNGSYVVESNIATHYRFIDYHIEVIGNIYENPELLETNMTDSPASKNQS